jgi:hypothetical protein
MTLDRVCDEIEQKGFSKREKFEERSLWVGGWVGMCVLCFFWCSKNQWGNIGSKLSLLFKHL